jgi:uncharacterized protein YndB with AHSA1/START domain
MSAAGTTTVTTPTDREIVITRVFDTPRELVWEAMSKPELLKRWLLGPPGWTMPECENDLRVGGTFRHVWRSADGAEMAMHGTYREVSPPDRCVRTETFDFGCPAQSAEQLATAVLTERNGQTTLTITVVYPSKQARDGAVASGMEHGVRAGHDRLAELLTQLA